MQYPDLSRMIYRRPIWVRIPEHSGSQTQVIWRWKTYGRMIIQAVLALCYFLISTRAAGLYSMIKRMIYFILSNRGQDVSLDSAELWTV